MKKECDHPEESINKVSHRFAPWHLSNVEHIFHCAICDKYCFAHESGVSVWVSLEDLIEQVQMLRSFDVFYERDLDPDCYITPLAQQEKSDVMRFMDDYEKCEPEMYDPEIYTEED